MVEVKQEYTHYFFENERFNLIKEGVIFKQKMHMYLAVVLLTSQNVYPQKLESLLKSCRIDLCYCTKYYWPDHAYRFL